VEIRSVSASASASAPVFWIDLTACTAQVAQIQGRGSRLGRHRTGYESVHVLRIQMILQYTFAFCGSGAVVSGSASALTALNAE
jgi:hypothetical protein